MEKRPQRSTPQARRRHEELVNLFTQALNDPVIAPAWDQVMESLLDWQHFTPEEQAGRITTVAALIEQRVPRLAAIYGPRLFGALLDLAAASASKLDPGRVPPEEVAGLRAEGLGRQYRLSPDNPITRTPEGAYLGLEEASPAQLAELEDYLHSLTPLGRPGSPKGQPKGISRMQREVLLAEVRRLKDEEGWSWPEVAKRANRWLADQEINIEYSEDTFKRWYKASTRQ